MGIFSRFFPAKKPVVRAPLFLHNTLGGEKQLFELPPRAKEVRMYNCGPTVYGPQHIGNLSMFVFTDILRRTLEYNNFRVKQVINFTDFGHLVSDADEGEDKMTKGLKREGLPLTLENMKILGEKYAELFLEDVKKLNINTERTTFPRASAYVPAQIAMVKTLEEKGYAYQTTDGVYFDTARFPAYGKLGNINLEGLREGARVAADSEKRHPTDFLLWKSSKKLGWDSPWGKGFPGWHIECSAMIRATLGEQIDIHTGGIEHIPVHHNNEIAQSESATGRRPLARFWMHRAHIQIEGSKIAKSEGNTVYLSEIIERGFHPLALRYLFLGAHYRTPSNFTWTALDAANVAFLKLRRWVDSLADVHESTPPETYRKRWYERLNDDLDTAGALAVVWDMLKDAGDISPAEIKAGLLDVDRVLGLGLGATDPSAQNQYEKLFGVLIPTDELPERVRTLVTARTGARDAKEWQHADALRKQIESFGYNLEDTAGGVRVFRRES
jgi:cysteinyl-tRNA synthetase